MGKALTRADLEELDERLRYCQGTPSHLCERCNGTKHLTIDPETREVKCSCPEEK